MISVSCLTCDIPLARRALIPVLLLLLFFSIQYFSDGEPHSANGLQEAGSGWCVGFGTTNHGPTCFSLSSQAPHLGLYPHSCSMSFKKKTNFVFSIHVSWGLFDSCSPLFDMFCIIWHTILGWVQNYQEHPSLPVQACFFTHSLTICHCFWNLKIYIGCFLCWWSLKHFFCLWGAHSSWLVTHGKLWASFLFWLPTLGVALIVLNNSS